MDSHLKRLVMVICSLLVFTASMSMLSIGVKEESAYKHTLCYMTPGSHFTLRYIALNDDTRSMLINQVDYDLLEKLSTKPSGVMVGCYVKELPLSNAKLNVNMEIFFVFLTSFATIMTGLITIISLWSLICSDHKFQEIPDDLVLNERGENKQLP